MYILRVCGSLSTDAITHGHGFELATFQCSNLIYRKSRCWPAPAHMGANQVFAQSETEASTGISTFEILHKPPVPAGPCCMRGEPAVGRSLVARRTAIATSERATTNSERRTTYMTNDEFSTNRNRTASSSTTAPWVPTSRSDPTRGHLLGQGELQRSPGPEPSRIIRDIHADFSA